MKEYDVKITETLEKTVTVQAESHDAAEEQVRAAYYNSEYILDSENFTGVTFGTTEEREVQKEQADTMNVLLVKPFMYPQAVQIGCELEDLQKAVGGDIEATYPFNEPVALLMHDEGKESAEWLYNERSKFEATQEPVYQVGDTVFLEGEAYNITAIGTTDVQLLPPGMVYPIYRAESKENFERLLRQDERNARFISGEEPEKTVATAEPEHFIDHYAETYRTEKQNDFLL